MYLNKFDFLNTWAKIFHYFSNIFLLFSSYLNGQKPRARDLGVPFVGTTGEFNVITDVEGVEVGYITIISVCIFPENK